MPPSQFRRAVAALASRYRWPRPGLGTAFLAAPILVASVLPLLVFAHEAHPAAPPAAVSAEERAFLEENEAAMTKMMNDMAVIELRYGKNEQLRRIAQEIIVDQMQEIAAMKLAIGEPATDTTPAPTQPPSAPNTTVHHHPGMQMDVSTGMKK